MKKIITLLSIICILFLFVGCNTIQRPTYVIYDLDGNEIDICKSKYNEIYSMCENYLEHNSCNVRVIKYSTDCEYREYNNQKKVNTKVEGCQKDRR